MNLLKEIILVDDFSNDRKYYCSPVLWTQISVPSPCVTSRGEPTASLGVEEAWVYSRLEDIECPGGAQGVHKPYI